MIFEKSYLRWRIYKIFKTINFILSDNFILVIKNKSFFIKLKINKYKLLKIKLPLNITDFYEYKNFIKIQTMNNYYRIYKKYSLKEINFEKLNKNEQIIDFIEFKFFLRIKINDGCYKYYDKQNLKNYDINLKKKKKLCFENIYSYYIENNYYTVYNSKNMNYLNFYNSVGYCLKITYFFEYNKFWVFKLLGNNYYEIYNKDFKNRI